MRASLSAGTLTRGRGDAGPLARDDFAGGDEERQGCVCAEADDADGPRGAADERCGEAIRRDPAGGLAAALGARFRKACEIVRNGWIGKVHSVYSTWASFHGPDAAREPIPDGFDYDRGWPTPWYRTTRSGGGQLRRRVALLLEYGSRKNGDWGRIISTSSSGRWDGRFGPVDSSQRSRGAEYQSHVYADGTNVWKNHPVKNGQMIQFIASLAKCSSAAATVWKRRPPASRTVR